MVPQILALIVLVIFAIYILVLYARDIMFIIINLPLLVAVAWRVYFEVTQRKMFYPYIFGIIIALLINLVFFRYLQIPYIWWTTMFIIQSFVWAQVLQFLWPRLKQNKK